ncbi:hypothetical protein FIBSPDRAFT_927898 [Athelia psychrophila]|uniref:Uncharacterized protein n=1 Tax=Athelia psychrophila TaxID=1759441 RepID=A0A166R5M2_9AGAM|nr:hypothetical protein FIBSPDRAFT_927898 [Fibularhizoctonia sp. CBS 109695]
MDALESVSAEVMEKSMIKEGARGCRALSHLQMHAVPHETNMFIQEMLGSLLVLIIPVGHPPSLKMHRRLRFDNQSRALSERQRLCLYIWHDAAYPHGVLFSNIMLPSNVWAMGLQICRIRLKVPPFVVILNYERSSDILGVFSSAENRTHAVPLFDNREGPSNTISWIALIIAAYRCCILPTEFLYIASRGIGICGNNRLCIPDDSSQLADHCAGNGNPIVPDLRLLIGYLFPSLRPVIRQDPYPKLHFLQACRSVPHPVSYVEISEAPRGRRGGWGGNDVGCCE